MMRIIGIDYGSKWTGISVTDPLQIIVNPLKSVETREIKKFLDQYIQSEPVERIVIGWPTHQDGRHTPLGKPIKTLGDWIKKKYDNIAVVYHDESYTSVRATQKIRESGAKKKKRQDKIHINTISAVIILQDYLGHI